jgi:hypothetical protein
MQWLAWAGWAQKPSIESFTPAAGEAGTLITLTGSNFSPVPGDNVVFFGTVRGEVTAATPTQLTVKVPRGAAHAPIAVIANRLIARSKVPFVPAYRSEDVGTGSFAATRNIADGSNGVALGDVDGDGRVDIVSVTPDRRLFVLRNQSNGAGFDGEPFESIALPDSAAYDVELADLDGDGKLDIVTISPSAESVRIMHNTGSAGTVSFAKAADLPFADHFGTIRGVAQVEVADLDGDGRLDILTGITELIYVGDDLGSVSIGVYQNVHAGGAPGPASFAPEIYLEKITWGGSNFENHTYLGDIAVGDLNGDGKPEVLTVVSKYQVAKHAVHAYQNNSTGTLTAASFAKKTLAQSGGGSDRGMEYTVAVADLDADGDQDVGFITWYETYVEHAGNYLQYAVSVLSNHGLGGTVSAQSFANREDYEVPLPWRALNFAFSDLTGDGNPDIIVTQEKGLSVYQNRGDDFGAPVDLTGSPEEEPQDIAAADLDGDGRPDLVVGNRTAVSVIRNQVAPAVPRLAVAPATGEVNATIKIWGRNFSSVPDENVVYFGAARATVSAAHPDTLWVVVPPGATYQPISVTAGGRTGYSRLPFSATFPSVKALDAAAFAVKRDFPVTAYPGVPPIADGVDDGLALGDFNADGKVDVAVTDPYRSQAVVFENRSTLRRVDAAPVPIPLIGQPGAEPGDFRPRGIASGDVNEDGLLDLVAGTGTDRAPGEEMAVLLAGPASTITAGTFAQRARLAAAPAETVGGPGLATGELNGDGRADILARAVGEEDKIALFLNEGGSDRAFRRTRDFYDATGPGYYLSPIMAALGDFNGDHKTDVVLANGPSTREEAFVYVLQNKSAGELIDAAAFGGPAEVYVDGGLKTYSQVVDLDVGDLDGDGALDIAVLVSASTHIPPDPAPTDDSRVVVLRNAGDGTFTRHPQGQLHYTPKQMALGDLDGDGKVDIAVVNADERSTVRIDLLHNESVASSPGLVMNFVARADIPTDGLPLGVAVGDLDGDGKPELLVKQATLDRKNIVLSVYRNAVKPLRPTLTAFAPVEGVGPGGKVTLRGTHFMEVDSVTFNGVNQPEFMVRSATEIEVTVPEGAGSGRIAVVTTGGKAVTGTDFIAISPAGAITGSTSVCEGQTEVLYTVPPVPGAAAYDWTLPPWATLVAGAGTNSIRVNVRPAVAPATGAVSVKGVERHYAGTPAASFAVAVTPRPMAPTDLKASVTVAASSASPGNFYVALTWKNAPNNGTLPGLVLERAEGATGRFGQIERFNDLPSSYSDHDVKAGTTYFYRISAVMGECFSAFSNVIGAAAPGAVVTALPAAVPDRLVLYPNPVQNTLYLEMPGWGAARAEVRITTPLGVLRKSIQCQPGAGRRVQSCDVRDLEAGVYLVTVRAGREAVIRKIVKL